MVAMTFDCLQTVVLILLYLSDGIQIKVSAASVLTSPKPVALKVDQIHLPFSTSTTSQAVSLIPSQALSLELFAAVTTPTVDTTVMPTKMWSSLVALTSPIGARLLSPTANVPRISNSSTDNSAARATSAAPTSTIRNVNGFGSGGEMGVDNYHQRHHHQHLQHNQSTQQRRQQLSHQHQQQQRAVSSDYGITNVTAQIGTNVYLPCKVNKIFNKSVSWVRMRDDHILTVDRVIFIADERFNAFHPTSGLAGEFADSWQLQIKYVQARDEGVYECQVSSEPKVSAKIRLHVVVPRTEMIGDSNRYVKEGSKVSLHCIVSGAIDPPLYIIWHQGNQQIFPDDRRGWRMDISRENIQTNPAHGTIGTLIIPAVRKRDSGNFTCSPSNSQPISTILHVINGEYSASAITSTASPQRSLRRGDFQLIATLLCALLMLLVQRMPST